MPIGICSPAPLKALLASAWVPVLDPVSPNAVTIRHLFVVVFLICLAIFLVVASLIVISIIRFRPAAGRVPKQDFGNHRSEIIWAIIPGLIVLAFAIVSIKLILSIISMPTSAVSEAGDADLIVVGHQWWWEVRYPASGAVTANEIHVPVGQKLRVRVSSADVIHSFWVPQLGPKMDMIPGHDNFVWLQADRPGIYEGACSEFCGDQHAWMRFTVIAESAPQYQSWLAHQTQSAPGPAGAKAEAGKAFFFTQTCANCHAIGGTNAVANAAPDLTHVAERDQLAAGLISNNPENLARWLRDPQRIKPGCLMPNFTLNDDQVTELVAFLEGLR